MFLERLYKEQHLPGHTQLERDMEANHRIDGNGGLKHTV